MRILEEHYEADNVTVTVEWDQLGHVTYGYSARVTPLAPLMFTGSTSVQLILQYNTEYNLSIVAATPCRETVIVAITLNCGEHTESYTKLHNAVFLVS